MFFCVPITFNATKINKTIFISGVFSQIILVKQI